MRNHNLETRPASASTTGPASYDSANRPTLVFPLRKIASVNDVVIKSSDPKYTAVPVSVDKNKVTFKVMMATFSPLANHEHNVPADTSGTTENAEINASGYLAVGAGGKIQGASAGTPAYGTSTEVTNGTDLSGVTFYGTAVGI